MLRLVFLFTLSDVSEWQVHEDENICNSLNCSYIQQHTGNHMHSVSEEWKVSLKYFPFEFISSIKNIK